MVERANHPVFKLVARFATFLRSLLTGGMATLADVATLAFAVGVLHVSPSKASVPALLVGAAVQFFGNRYFAFRAARAPMANQAALFVATEAVTMVLNAALYQAVASHVHLTLTTAVIARVVTTNLVFLLWSYPVWKRVFKPGIAGSPARAPARAGPGKTLPS
jgi:putative flippase GtrA